MYKNAIFKGHIMQNQASYNAIKLGFSNKENAIGLVINRLQRIPRPFELLFSLLIGLVMSSLTPTIAEAAEHIKVTKEVLLEKGVPIFPSAIIQTKESGYVVIGNIRGGLAWAVRVDANGGMQWRYQTPNAIGSSTFEGAVTLRDDSTLLCGHKRVRVQEGVDIVGILTHIDKTGKVLSDRVIHPKETGDFGGSYIRRLLPWGDGYALIGDIYRVSGPPHPGKIERLYWILALDAAGEVKWEKLIPATEGLNPRAIYVAPDLDLIFQANRISQNGEINNTAPADSASHDLIPQIIAGTDGQWKVVETNNPLRHNSLISKVEPKISYSLPSQAIVEFGSIRRNNVYYAAIGWSSLDKKQLEAYEFVDTLWLDDAIPTGVPGEFVTIRQQNSDLKKLGMFLSFIQIK